jgi:hypothetical protein
VVSVSNEVIKRLYLPELPRSAYGAVDLTRCELFPACNNAAKGVFLVWFKDRMSVIRHDRRRAERYRSASKCTMASRST